MARLNVFRREAGVVDLGGFQCGLDHAHPIGLIVDGEVLFQAQPIGIGTEQPDAEAVKGADPHALGRQQIVDPAAHLLGGLVGEGDGQDLIRPDPFVDEMGDAAGDDARLAAAGPGEDEQGAFGAQHRFALGRRQVGEIGFRV